jgi:twitching motility protein PilU
MSDPIKENLHALLKAFVAQKGSDLFITADAPVSIKVDGELTPLTKEVLTPEVNRQLVFGLMSESQKVEFEEHRECNFAYQLPGVARFRVNAFIQRGEPGLVVRVINTKIPDPDKLNLPPILKALVMEKRGLILFVGGTGSGKSTSLAALVGHRNHNSHGHIITIEDPIEFVHPNDGCIVTQREVGADTESYEAALKNTLRQAPDVILIGEIRARETMDHAVAFAETGHLCLSTLHANNTNQALDRIINFFPEERRDQLLMDLSLNLKAIVSQRLIPKIGGGRVAAIEILINTPRVADLIFKGEVHELKEVVANSREQGMQTFDQALFELYESGQISYEDALRNADSLNDLRLTIKLKSKRRQQDEDVPQEEKTKPQFSLQEENEDA